MKLTYSLFLSIIIISCQPQRQLSNNSTNHLPFEIQNILGEFSYLKLKKAKKLSNNGKVNHFEIDSKNEINKKAFEAIKKYIWEMLVQNNWSQKISGNGYARFEKGKNTLEFLIYPDYFNNDESLQIHIIINQTNY